MSESLITPRIPAGCCHLISGACAHPESARAASLQYKLGNLKGRRSALQTPPVAAVNRERNKQTPSAGDCWEGEWRHPRKPLVFLLRSACWELAPGAKKKVVPLRKTGFFRFFNYFCGVISWFWSIIFQSDDGVCPGTTCDRCCGEKTDWFIRTGFYCSAACFGFHVYYPKQ